MSANGYIYLGIILISLGVLAFGVAEALLLFRK